jgi:inhibitor of KinA
MSCKVSLYGTKAVLVEFENEISIEVNMKVVSLYRALISSKSPNISSIIPAYNSLVIKYWIAPKVDQEKVLIEYLIDSGPASAEDSFKTIEVPVCYSPEMGMDLNDICDTKRLTAEQVIKTHTAAEYHVYMLGFTPGFPYLGGLDKSLSMPRKKDPRISIPKGSVAITNEQTGIYPSASPGGWQIIGRTPVELFKAGSQPMINIGDKVKFYAISKEEFDNYSPSLSAKI